MKITIITATLNNQKTIEQCLRSVASQTYKDIEHIIIDGKSKDKTLEIVKKFEHIKIIVSEKDNGIYYALNKGIKLSTGDIIGFLNADDFFASKKVIENIVNTFKTKNAKVVYSDLVYVMPDGEKIFRYWQAGEFSVKKLKNGWMPPHPTFYAKKQIYNKFGLFNTKYSISADYDLMLRILKTNPKVEYIPQVTIKMRIGGKSNKSIKLILQKMKEDIDAIRNNKIGGIFTLFKKNFRKLNQFFKNKNISQSDI